MKELVDFVQKWCHPDYPPKAVDAAALAEVERELGVVFPNDYKSAIFAVGLPQPTAALLHNIVETGVELHDLSDLYDPREIVASTLDWRKLGLPEKFVAIGSDCSGNMFCFDENDMRLSAVSSAPIYFWDHDLNYADLVSTSFPEWLRSYLGSWSAGLGYKDF